MLYSAELECPYCAESFVIEIDISAGREQSWTYDCEVCCKPIEVHASFDSDREEFVLHGDRGY